MPQALDFRRIEAARPQGAEGRAPPVRFPIDFNKAEPFVAYMASPEYEQWKACKNGAKQTE